MRYAISCILMVSCLNSIFADSTIPNYELGWRCPEEECGRDNDRDESLGCEGCEEKEREAQENERLKNEYYREVLDAEDPEGAPHSKEEAEEFERSIQSK